MFSLLEWIKDLCLKVIKDIIIAELKIICQVLQITKHTYTYFVNILKIYTSKLSRNCYSKDSYISRCCMFLPPHVLHSVQTKLYKRIENFSYDDRSVRRKQWHKWLLSLNKYLEHFEEFPKGKAVVKPAAVINGTSALCALLMMLCALWGKPKQLKFKHSIFTVWRKRIWS